MKKKRQELGPGSWKFERRRDELAPVPVFVRRLIASLEIALGLMAAALFLGVLGYHFIAGFGWVDSVLEASMILGGMGPVKELQGDGSKIFASVYALFSGVVFIALMGILLGPVVHRIMHKFHIDEEDVDQPRKN